MKLKNMIDAVSKELEMADLGNRRARLTLAFTVKSDRDGEAECEFVEASSISRARPEELHHLEILVDPTEGKIAEPELRKEQAPILPEPRKPKPAVLPAKRSNRDVLTEEELDTPTFLRELAAGS